MKNLSIATAQFEHRSNDKQYNLRQIELLAEQARHEGAEMVCFHELSITGYTFLKDVTKAELEELSETVDQSPSLKILKEISADLDIAIMAGFIERSGKKLFNTYAGVYDRKLIARFSKLHPFIHPALTPGNGYEFFNFKGWNCSILVCYDNNIIENVRAVTLMGTQLLIAPHVTGGTPSPMPGRDWIDKELWDDRQNKPNNLMAEFRGPKGREWLMKWLPARAFDNGIYVAFSNSVGLDHDHITPGNAMILDPFGNILGEANDFTDRVILAELVPEKLELAGGFRYRKARRPDLYAKIISGEHHPETKPAWMN